MESCKSLGSLKSFLWYAHLSYLGSVSWVFTPWVFPGLTVGSGYSLIVAVWQVFFSLLSSHQVSTAYLEGLQLLMTVTFLFTDMAGNISFLNTVIFIHPKDLFLTFVTNIIHWCCLSETFVDFMLEFRVFICTLLFLF